jgi:class 3 adenylate cyclase/tetratricopeptide (TPR) repeat protein
MIVCPNCGEENPERARFCWSCGAVLGEQPRAAAEERKVVSVLFVDLAGFTAASEQTDPEEVRARLRPYHARVKQEIERFGGTVEKFIGDAVMAVFGAPVAHEDDAERAVTAALRIVDAIAELNEQHAGLELAVRGAVNTGEAMVTLTARPEEGEGIVAGDVVNTAFRLQEAAPVGGIAVGEPTYRATRELFEYDELEPVKAKGKADEIALWWARAPRRRLGVDVEPAARAPLIGRDDDLALLRSTYARTLRDASAQLVTITGEPGVGKTRLATEFRTWLNDQPELVFWRQGRSLPYGEGITYWALGEMVKAHAGILESAAPEEAVAKLKVAVAEVAEDESERDWFESSLAPLVGAGETTAAADREEAFTAWRRFIEGVAAQRPLVLVFEDLHWADDALLAFIEHLVDWSSSVPLLVLCTGRPELFERHPGWGGGKRNSTTISLSPLGDDDTTRLIAALLRQTVLPVETHARLLEHAGGNPLYAEEFVRMLDDHGMLSAAGGLRDTQIRVPDTVQSLIAARLDTLRPKRKALLQDAAVVGKVFWAGALAAMGETDEPTVREGLHELVRKELVRAGRHSSVKDQAEYAFWHAIVRDVAYAQIPRAVRARKHIAAAEWIEAMAAERVTDHAELLAYHYEQALELTRAAGVGTDIDGIARAARRSLQLAGDRAMSLDLTKAATYYRRALALYEAEDPGRADLLVKAALANPESLDDAQGELEDALAMYRSVGNELRQGWVLIHLAQEAHARGETTRGDELLSEAIDLLERHPPGEELAAAHTRRAARFAMSGRPRECLDVTERALPVVEAHGLRRYEARLHQYHGVARFELGDVEGLADIRYGVQLGRELGDLITVAFGHSNLGTLTLMLSAQEAADIYTEAVDFAERRGMGGSTMWLKAERTWTLYDLGRWDELLREVAAIEDWGRPRGGGGYVSMIALPQKARVLVQRGRVAEAALVVDEYLAGAREARDPQVLIPALVAAAEAAVAAGDLAEARGLVREAETGSRGIHRSRYLADLVSIAVDANAIEVAEAFLANTDFATGLAPQALTAARGVFKEAVGENETARALHDEAAAGWAAQGSVPGRARSLFRAGRCVVALGHPHEATARLSEARELFVRLDARPSVAAVDDSLARATSVSA